MITDDAITAIGFRLIEINIGLLKPIIYIAVVVVITVYGTNANGQMNIDVLADRDGGVRDALSKFIEVRLYFYGVA